MTYKKKAIPLSVRRDVARRYGCEPGGEADAHCHYCDAKGRIHWWRLYSGRPSGWVVFPGFELDHVHSEFLGGPSTAENIVLSCRRCNRSRGWKQ